MRRWRLPAFQNVVNTGTAVLPNIPMGEVFHAIRLVLGGTFTKAEITGIRLRLGGKVIWNITGSHLDKINQYMGETANAAYLTLNFAEPEAKTILGEAIGALDTSLGYSGFSMEVDITGATSPTLVGYAYTTPPQGGGARPLFKAYLAATWTPGAAGQFALALPLGSSSGNLIKRVHNFHANITQLDVKLDGVDLLDNGTVGLLQFEQNELTRTTQAGHLAFDPLVRDNQSDVIPTVRQDGTPAALDYRATVSAADTIVTYTEMYTTLDRL